MNAVTNSPLRLRAGPLVADFFPDELFLRYLRIGGEEVLRGVYFALRDQDWNTPQPEVSISDQTIGDDGFSLRVEARWEHGDIRYVGNYELKGSSRDGIHFSFAGKAASRFLGNRIGFVVLHGAQLAGETVEAGHVDGSVETSVFPESISPHQPFLNLRSLTHQTENRLVIGTTFEGETFEMEDQRNWTDASYKTYGTPLAKPFPVEVVEGETLEQSIRIKWACNPATLLEPDTFADPMVRLDASGEGNEFELPGIGLEKGWGANEPYSDDELDYLRALQLGHLRVEIRFAHPGWKEDLRSGIRLAGELGLALELPVFQCGGHEAEWPELLKGLIDGGVAVKHWLILHESESVPSDYWIRVAAERIRTSGLGGSVATGTNANFTELNRQVPAPGPYRGLCYAINPQVHAFDDGSLIETLSMHAVTSRNARRLVEGMFSHLSPVTLTQRFNPVATSGSGKFAYTERPDPRQKTNFGAVWTAGSIVQGALGEAKAMTFYKTRGPTGVMAKGAANDSDLYPLYFVFRFFGKHKDWKLRPMTGGKAFEVEGVAMVGGDDPLYMIINYTPTDRQVECTPDVRMPLPRAVRVLTPESGKATLSPARKGVIQVGLPGRSVVALGSWK